MYRKPEPTKPATLDQAKNPTAKLDESSNQPNAPAKKVKENREVATTTAASSKDLGEFKNRNGRKRIF